MPLVNSRRGYPVFGGYVKAPEWLETYWLLSLFEKNQKHAKRRYQGFVESVQNEKIEDPSADIESGFILGGVDFVNWVKDNFLNKDLANKEIPQLRSLKPKPTPENLVPVKKIIKKLRCDPLSVKMFLKLSWYLFAMETFLPAQLVVIS